jgi:DNA (cytosine-5)-methyltransferase 1
MEDGSDPAKRLERLERLKAKHGNGNGAGRTLGSEVQTWATPRASMVDCGSDSGSAQRLAQGANPGFKDQAKAWATPCAGDERASASQGTVSLGRQVRREVVAWPTATATDGRGGKLGQRKRQLGEAAEHLWPTATAGDSRGSGSRNAEGSTAHQGVSLTDMVMTGDSLGRLARPTEPAGTSTSLGGLALNPRFVEALMGWPIGFSDCGSSETESSLTKQPLPGASSGAA